MAEEKQLTEKQKKWLKLVSWLTTLIIVIATIAPFVIMHSIWGTKCLLLGVGIFSALTWLNLTLSAMSNVFIGVQIKSRVNSIVRYLLILLAAVTLSIGIII